MVDSIKWLVSTSSLAYFAYRDLELAAAFSIKYRAPTCIFNKMQGLHLFNWDVLEWLKEVEYGRICKMVSAYLMFSNTVGGCGLLWVCFIFAKLIPLGIPSENWYTLGPTSITPEIVFSMALAFVSFHSIEKLCHSGKYIEHVNAYRSLEPRGLSIASN